ncbi:MAG: diguanylate cyclase [Cyanobacteria bacterium J06627_32]
MPHTHLAPTKGTVIIWQQVSPEKNRLSHLTEMLQQRGCQVVRLETTRHIAQAIVEHPPDLLLIPLYESEIEGRALCQSLRQQLETYHLPILFLGARDAGQEKVNALRCGGNGYLQLPINPEAFWLQIGQYLQTSQLVRKLQADRMSLSQQLSEVSHILAEQARLQQTLAKENQALQQIAFIDGLTQVGNRRSFNQSIVQLWREAYEHRQPLSLLLCDIDYFKRYNDTYGHLGGDDCLKAVASALVRGAHRHQDRVARYGGEEFAILLPGTDAKGANQVALAVQAEVDGDLIPHRGSLIKEYVSLSIGVCTLIPKDDDPLAHEQLIHNADEALYTAKIRGRDRTVVSTPTGLISLQSTGRTNDNTHYHNHLVAPDSFSEPCFMRQAEAIDDTANYSPTKQVAVKTCHSLTSRPSHPPTEKSSHSPQTSRTQANQEVANRESVSL